MQSIVSIREAGDSVIIELKNEVALFSIGLKNDHLMWCLLKAEFYLRLKTIRTVFIRWMNS